MLDSTPTPGQLSDWSACAPTSHTTRVPPRNARRTTTPSSDSSGRLTTSHAEPTGATTNARIGSAGLAAVGLGVVVQVVLGLVM